MEPVDDGHIARIQGLGTHSPRHKSLWRHMHPYRRLARADFCQGLPWHGLALDAAPRAHDHFHRLTDGDRRVVGCNAKQQRQRLLAQLSAAADEYQLQRGFAGQTAGGCQCRADAGIVGQRLDCQSRRIDDFEQGLASIDDLAGEQVVRGAYDARCGRPQRAS